MSKAIAISAISIVLFVWSRDAFNLKLSADFFHEYLLFELLTPFYATTRVFISPKKEREIEAEKKLSLKR